MVSQAGILRRVGDAALGYIRVSRREGIRLAAVFYLPRFTHCCTMSSDVRSSVGIIPHLCYVLLGEVRTVSGDSKFERS